MKKHSFHHASNDHLLDLSGLSGSHLDNHDDEFDKISLSKPLMQHYTVCEREIGTRLDKIATDVFDGFSRVQIQGFIDDESLLVNDAPQKSKYRVKLGDILTLSAMLDHHGEDLPEDITLDVVYADDEVIVINKPVGLVVHPGAGNRTGTLVLSLIHI